VELGDEEGAVSGDLDRRSPRIARLEGGELDRGLVDDGAGEAGGSLRAVIFL